MRDLTRWVPAVLLGVGCLLSLGLDRQRSVPLVQPLESLPAVLDGATGREWPLSDEERRATGVTSYVNRVFEGPPTFWVYVGYYDRQTQGKTIHSPKNCLPGSGWEPLKSTRLTVPTAAGPQMVNRYVLQNKEHRALVLYWYQGRGRVAANEYQVKWELLRDAALYGRSEEALVRVVVFLEPGVTEADAERLAASVASSLIPAVFRALPA